MNNEKKKKLKIITRHELEEALAKLFFYINISLKYEQYKTYRKNFADLLKIVNKWLMYYSEDNNLKRVTNEEVIMACTYLDKMPFDAYGGDYYEEVETWLDVVIYYSSCPIGMEFNSEEIVIKGNDNIAKR